MRRQSPPRRRRPAGPPRRVSPLRNQPAPPGEERGNNAWDEPPKNKRARSRPRDWAVPQEPPMRIMHPEFEESYLDNNFMGRNHHDGIIAVDPAVMNFNSYNQMIPPEVEMHRRRSPGRKIVPSPPRRPKRDRSPLIRGRSVPRRSPVGRRPSPPPRRASPPPRRSPVRRSSPPARRTSPPARRSSPPVRRSSPPPRRSPVRRSPARDRKTKRSPSPKKKPSGKETSADRINRLEKLVEKLVEHKEDNNKASPVKQKGSSFPELIPSNHRFTTSMWLNAIHEECLKQNYDERSCIRFMQDKMTGILKAWFKTVSNFDFTWPELKLLITKTFPDNVDFAQTLKYLVSRDKTPEETITQYFFSKLYLCEACKITGENAVSCLIDGLNNPFMKQDVRARNFLTPEALYSEYLAKYPEGEVHRVEHREVIPEYPPEEYMAPQQEYMHERKTRPMVPRCLTCKKLGHSTLMCRHAPICYKCKKKGHIAAKCYAGNPH